MTGTLNFGSNGASPERLATDVATASGATLEATIAAREAALQQAQIEALYQAGRAMTALSDIRQNMLI